MFNKEDMKQMQELQKLIQDHFVRGGHILEYGSDNRDLEAAQRAEDCFTKGYTKLKRMKLSRDNRRNIRLLRNAIECAIKSAKELRKGRHDKASKLMQESSDYADKYTAAVVARAGKS